MGELAEVLERRRAGAYQVLTLVAPRIAAAAAPGQFVEVLVPGQAVLLRRPFSIHRADRAGSLGTVELAFDVIGPGTAALAALRPHDTVDLLGPLGRPFTLPPPGTPCLLAGGGYGTAPLFFLAERLRPLGCRVAFLVGAATAPRLFQAMEARRLGNSLTVTTDDGSAGRRGLVTDPMAELVARSGSRQVYACGPMPMLAAVSRVAAGLGVACQVAVEEQMACGTGICFACVIPLLPTGPPAAATADGAAGGRMARACVDGPVFDGAAVAWADLGHAAAPEAELVL
jgi:dihydroorotate dehydrogenase electron transfer subunit